MSAIAASIFNIARVAQTNATQSDVIEVFVGRAYVARLFAAAMALMSSHG